MKPWRILKKYQKRVDAGSVELHLVVERGGVERDKIVSGHTFHTKEVGDMVDLTEHSGTSEARLVEMGNTLRAVLVRAGVVAKDATPTGPELLLAAEEYVNSAEPEPAPPTSPELPPPPQQPDLRDDLIAMAARLDDENPIYLSALRVDLSENGTGHEKGGVVDALVLDILDAALEGLAE